MEKEKLEEMTIVCCTWKSRFPGVSQETGRKEVICCEHTVSIRKTQNIAEGFWIYY